MRAAIGLVSLALLVLIGQGVLATVIPAPYCPDLVLLIVIAMGLRWNGSVGGFVMAAIIGYATDLLSGSLMGQNALLMLLVFTSAFVASRQLNLKGPLPLAVFAVVCSGFYGIALLAVTGFFTGGLVLGWSWAFSAIVHALVNGVFAPAVSSLLGRVTRWSGEEEPGRRLLRPAPRSVSS